MKFRNGQLYRTALSAFAAATIMAGIAVRADAQAGATNPPAQAPSAATTAPNAAADAKVVLRVGTEEVTKADMDQLISGLSPQTQRTVASEGKRAVGEQYAVMMVLDQQAEKDHLDASPEIRQRLELEKRQLLAQAEYQKLSEQIQVTPEEVSQYFDAHKDAFDVVKICEVIVRKKAEDAKAGDPGLSPDQAQSKINAIRAALTGGSNIEAVKKQFSVPNTVVVDSDPRAVHRGQLLPELDKEAFSLKAGEVSQPYQTPQAIVMFQVASHQAAVLKDATEQIENDLRQQKLEAEVAGLRKSANVWLDDDYFKQESAPGTPAPESSVPQAPKKP
jgi:hypothetical protein